MGRTSRGIPLWRRVFSLFPIAMWTDASCADSGRGASIPAGARAVATLSRMLRRFHDRGIHAQLYLGSRIEHGPVQLPASPIGAGPSWVTLDRSEAALPKYRR